MNCKTIRTTTLVALILVACLGATVTTASAQSGSAPSVTLTSANVNVDVGQSTNTVTGTYKLKVSSIGSGDQKLTAFTGTIWSFPGRSVSDLSATVNGKTVSPKTSKDDEVVHVSIPIQNVQAGDTVTLKMNYKAANAGGNLKTPIFVPSYMTPGSKGVVDMTVTLPSGQQPHSDVFPAVESKNGNVVKFNLLHMPGFVFMKYGKGSGTLFSLSNMMTLIGLLIILGFVGAFFRYDRGLSSGDVE